VKLRWRVSRGARRSLGWIPFKAASLKRKGRGLRFCGKTFRVFESERLQDAKWRDGCFAQDAVGDWWLCLPVTVEARDPQAHRRAVGIDLDLKASRPAPPANSSTPANSFAGSKRRSASRSVAGTGAKRSACTAWRRTAA
jgi:hypothetical protein